MNNQNTNQNNKLEIIRHSTTHILAAAVLEMFPEAKLGIGPTIEDGFYYDFDLPRTLIPEDLPLLEEKMREIIKQNLSFEKTEVDAKKAQALFKKAKQPYKVELIKELSTDYGPPSTAKAETTTADGPRTTAKSKSGRRRSSVVGSQVVSVYKTGSFVDLCRGPHLDSAGEIKPDSFKLLKIAGAYWRGNEKNKMLQRIYGTAFETKKDLDEYLHRLEEAEKRDHRKIGKEFDLFSFHEEAPGFAFWHPKGMILRESLMSFYNELHKQAGYQNVSTPILLAEELWHQSGHWDHYKNNMYFIKIDDRVFAIKPMNCPGVILVYKNQNRSYRDLPLRFAEQGEVHRHEPSGTLHGLFRVRAFRQDDAHIFASENQTENEIKNICQIIIEFYKIFNFSDVEIELSTRPEKSIGGDEIWKKAETVLEKTLNNLNLKFKINPGEGAFYGPKIDFHIKDSLNRSWQCGTIQIDFSMPERFDLAYIDKDGKLKRPVMIHRTVLGSIQRFIGILIEHFAGAFPVWLSPEQVWVLPIGSRHEEYAFKVAEALRKDRVRVVVKNENETIAKKIREGEIRKIPYLLVVGDKEMSSDSVAVRQRGKGDLGQIKAADFSAKITKEINEKTI